MLKELRGKLDEIACDMGTGNARIDDVRQHAMQSMAEFVEERARIVDAQQTRLALAPLAKFITLTTIGSCGPSSFCWPRKPLIHAPLRFEGLAK